MTSPEDLASHNQETSTRKRERSSSQKSDHACHFVLQAKGGVGKTLAASLIAQHLRERDAPLVCIDTDPRNHSFTEITGLGAEHIKILDNNDELEVETLNAMLSRMIEEPSNFVIDNGAASFMPMTVYLVRQGLFDLLASSGKRVVVHTIVTGNSAMEGTALAFADIVEQFPKSVEIVLWLNPVHGPLVTDDGVPFAELVIFKENVGRTSGVVHMPDLHPTFSGRVFKRMLKNKLTFDEAKTSSEFDLVSKLWLEQARSQIREQLQPIV